MARLNWDALGSDWTLSYQPQLIQRPFSGKPLITISQTEVSIKGTFQPMELLCIEDADSIDQWFRDGERLIRCPAFYRSPISWEGKTSYYDKYFKCIRWVNSPYSFSGGYYVGSNADSNFNVINPDLPVEWKVKIAPVNRGYKFHQPSVSQPYSVAAIEFTVLPRLQPENVPFDGTNA